MGVKLSSGRKIIILAYADGVTLKELQKNSTKGRYSYKEKTNYMMLSKREDVEARQAS